MNSPYAKTLFLRKFISSFIDTIFVATNNLYLIAKLLIALVTFKIFSLPNTMIEVNIWLA